MSQRINTHRPSANSEEPREESPQARRSRLLAEKMAGWEEGRKEKYLRQLARARQYKKDNAEAISRYQKQADERIKNDPILKAKKLESSRMTRKRNPSTWKAYDLGRDPAKIRASNIIRCRVYRGTLKRQPCEVCKQPQAQAHHDDYTQPLKVRWLCPQHHIDLHKIEKYEKQ